MNKLSLETYVIICRQTGVHYIDKQKAINLEQLLNSNSPPRSIKISDSIIMLNDIAGVVPAEKYEQIQKERKGQWKCTYSTWHNRNEQCRCGWGKHYLVKDVTPIKKEIKVTPEQAKKNKIILDLIRKKRVSFSDMKKLKSKPIIDLEAMLKNV